MMLADSQPADDVMCNFFAHISSPAFVPAEDRPEWVEATFLDPPPPLHNRSMST